LIIIIEYIFLLSIAAIKEKVSRYGEWGF